MSPGTNGSQLEQPHAPGLLPPQLRIASKYFLAGGVAGGVSRTAVAPLSRLKVLVQVNSKSVQYQLGVLPALRQIVREEGVRGLYVGNGADVIRIMPHSACKFLLYEHLSSHANAWLAGSGAEWASWQPALRLACGAAAGIVAGTITYPLDMIRGRLMVQGRASRHPTTASSPTTTGAAIGNDSTATAAAPAATSGHQERGRYSGGVQNPKPYSGLVGAARAISRDEGFLTLYRGWLPSFVGTVLYSGLKFGIYETLKDAAAQREGLPDSRRLGLLPKLAAGAVAGGVGQTVAYPLEVIRRRLQAGACASHGGAPPPGMAACASAMVRTEGWGSLYKGLRLNYIRVVPGTAISFAIYEAMKEVLGMQSPLAGGGGGMSLE